MFRQGPTPVEIHKIKGISIFVKRDDLFSLPPAPPMAKLRGINLLLPRLRADGFSLVGVFGAAASQVCHALAAAMNRFPDMECLVGYVPTKARPLPSPIAAAKSLGAQLLPLRPNVLNVCYHQVRRQVEQRHGYMIPFGFELPESVQSVALEAATVPAEMTSRGTVVVCCGSGVTLAGLYKGLVGRPSLFVGVSSGRSLDKIQSCLRRNHAIDDTVHLVEPLMRYSAASRAACPFPCDAYYDRKAWQHLTSNVHKYPKPILFWNVGA